MRLHRTSLFVAAATTAVLTVVALIGGLPIWGLGLIAVALLSGLGLRATLRAPTVAPDPVPEPADLDHQVLQPSTFALSGLHLPSASQGEDFVLSARVNWISLEPDWTDAQLCRFAIESIRQRATAVVRHHSVRDLGLARSDLETLLTVGQPDAHDRVRAWIADIQLALSPALEKHLTLVSTLRHHEELEDLQRQRERRWHGYLREEILATPGSGVVWWLNQHPDQLDRAVELIPTFTRLSNAANNRPELEPVREQPQAAVELDQIVQLADHPNERPEEAADRGPDAGTGNFDHAVATFLDGLGEAERQLKADALAMLEQRFGRVDRAERIRGSYDVEPAERFAAPQTDPADHTSELGEPLDRPPSTTGELVLPGEAEARPKETSAPGSRLTVETDPQHQPAQDIGQPTPDDREASTNGHDPKPAASTNGPTPEPVAPASGRESESVVSVNGHDPELVVSVNGRGSEPGGADRMSSAELDLPARPAGNGVTADEPSSSPEAEPGQAYRERFDL